MWLLEKINKIDNFLVRERKQKLSISAMKEGIVFILLDPTNIKKIMRK